jgi:pseudouridine synthase
LIVRLNKFLSQAGVCSRREADRWIEEGRVQVNGRIVQDLGHKIDGAKDKVVAAGKSVRPAADTSLYVLLHKPRGTVVTVKDPFGRPTVMDLLGRLPARVFPVGRLDTESEGLLLLTNDGDLAFKLTHPRFEVKKAYLAEVEGSVGEDALEKLRKGIFLEGRRTAPAAVQVVRKGRARSLVRIEIHEGRKREIRKMFEALGFRTSRLVRVEFAGLVLEGLKPGRWRHLNAGEIARLKKLGTSKRTS